jgi:predicted nuclease of predicted toxin-antitoxin system
LRLPEALRSPPNSVRILADTNIVAQAVRALRALGHDVLYVGERPVDPGDLALLIEAAAGGRVFVTKDRDIGALVHRDSLPHHGVLLLDDLGNASAESELIVAVLSSHRAQLAASAFLRAGVGGVRASRD